MKSISTYYLKNNRGVRTHKHSHRISWFWFRFTTLTPQSPKGCLEKQNHSLSSNLVVWCTKIGLKTKKVRKTSEMTGKTTKNDGFLMFFSSFWVLGLILVHQTAKFELSGQFGFSRHPCPLFISTRILKSLVWKI